jgi:hypothetical protein
VVRKVILAIVVVIDLGKKEDSARATTAARSESAKNAASNPFLPYRVPG